MEALQSPLIWSNVIPKLSTTQSTFKSTGMKFSPNPTRVFIHSKEFGNVLTFASATFVSGPIEFCQFSESSQHAVLALNSVAQPAT